MAHLFFRTSQPFNMGPQDIKFAPKRDFHYFGASVLAAGLASNKTFTNPNFVNLNKYQTQPVKSQSDNAKIYANSSLINSIKEHCPDIIDPPNFCKDKSTREEGPNMGMTRSHNIDIKEKKERSHKRKQPRKNSKQNQNKQLFKELFDFDNMDDLQSSFEVENSPRIPNKFDLNKILIDKPLKKLVSTIPIPIARNRDMVVTLLSQSPPTRPPQMSESPKPKNGHQIYFFDKQGRPTNCILEKKDSIESNIMADKQNHNKNHQNKPENYARQKFPSICDSEDSFIVFEDDTCQNNEKNKQMHNRHRMPSVCESEDSFIVFDNGIDTDVTDSDCDLTEFEGEGEDESESDEESSFDVVEPRKVRFASPGKLCKIHLMVKWSYAYQAARKGPWEEYARDRSRFRDRIGRTEDKIKGVLEKDHRTRIYQSRFEEKV